VTAKLVRSVKAYKNRNKKQENEIMESKLLVSRSSESDEDDRSSNSDTRKFEEEHGIKSIQHRHPTRDKLIIKV